jgi:glycosyltransferase involved in cell wall biosynthesis
VNILYHHRTLADGAEGIHIREMVEAFRGVGHRVEVHALAHGQVEGQGGGGPLAAVRRKMPQALYECAALALNLSDYLAIRRRLRTGRIDLVYKRHALLDVGAAIAARRAGVPLVLEVNTAYSAPSLRKFEPVSLLPLVRRAERLALRVASLVVAVSTPLAEYLRELGGPGVRVLVLPNGANTVLFDPAAVNGAAVRARYGLEGKFVVGWAGVLRRWHGIEVLIDALSRTAGAHLLLVGDGPDRRLLEALAAERGVTDRLTITGRLPHTAMPEHLAALDVAVAAADRTGLASPMKIVEYMAMGRPVLLPRGRNFEDLVQHERSGFFFRDGDADDLARGLALLRDSPGLRDRLGRGARSAVEEQLNWRANAMKVLDAVTRGDASGSQR